MKPDISYVIPAYNAEAWVGEAIGSLIHQTHKNIEVLVVDDGSTDATRKVIEHFVQSDPRVKGLYPEKNLGRGKARNFGNAQAQAPIIGVLDADDMADAERTKNTLKLFKSGADFVHGAVVVVDMLLQEKGKYIPEAFDLKKALEVKQNGIIHSSVAYTKALWEKHPYDEGEYAAIGLDDWHQQLRMAVSGARFETTPKVLGAYRMLRSSVTQTRDEKKVVELKEAFLASLAVPA